MDFRRSQWANTPSGEVVRGAANGDEEAWDELHRRYHKMIAGVARSSGCPLSDIPDVQQAVWARLIKSIGRLREPDAIGGWLAVVTRRECFRLGGTRPPIVQVDEADRVETQDDEPLAMVLHAERRSAVRQAVADLPLRRRTLLETMLDHPDLGYEQLADRLSMPVGSIGPTRQRSLDDLRHHRDLMAWRVVAHSA
jgi:RNA polymerase sigma factor (sigma-70 family)